MTAFAFCAFITSVFDAATAPAEALSPAPPALPPQLGKVLGLVRTLIARGKNLADKLRQHTAGPAVPPSFAFIASIFATSDPAAILARVTRGLLRAAALDERLRRRAARGLELKPAPIRLPRAPKPCTARSAAPPHDQAPSPTLASPPTLEQILAKDRRRPIGAVLVEICRDLGILPGHMDPATWKELRLAVILYGGSLSTLVLKRARWQLPKDPAAAIPTDSAGRPAPPEDWRKGPPPEQPPLPAGRGWGMGPGP